MKSNAIDTTQRPSEIWNQLDYEKAHGPIQTKFPTFSETGSWVGCVPGGDDDYTGATVLPIKDVDGEISNLLFVKHSTPDDCSHEFAYIPTAPIQGCFVSFGNNAEQMLVTSDLLTAAALADRTPFSAHCSIFPENTLDVAKGLASKHPTAFVVICEDAFAPIDDLPSNICQVLPPQTGFYKKVLSNPEQVLGKITETIEGKKNMVTEVFVADTVKPKKGLNGTTLVRSSMTLIQDCISTSEESALIITLYVFFTHLSSKARHAPLLGLCSPLKRCGKTTTLRLIAQLVRHPAYVKVITKSALEIIADKGQTPVLDELDTFLEKNPGLIGLINGGVEDIATSAHTGKQGAVVYRKTYGAKIYAMIGRPPETIFDRSIIVSLKRKSVTEAKVKLDSKENVIRHLSREIKRWCEANIEVFGETIALPLDIDNDRFRDNYAPLLRIAACISPSVERDARAAMTASALLQQDTEDGGEQLLCDIKRIFDDSGVKAISSAELAMKLQSAEDSVWAHRQANKALGPVRLAQMLGLFEIKPERIRIDEKQVRGYRREWFEDAFSRYCTTDEEVT